MSQEDDHLPSCPGGQVCPKRSRSSALSQAPSAGHWQRPRPRVAPECEGKGTSAGRRAHRVTGVCAQSCPTLRPHRLPPPRLLRSWNFPCKNTGASCHFLLQGIFPTQGPNQCLLRLLHWQAGSLALHHLGSHCYLLTLKMSGLEYPSPPPFFLLLA